MHSILRLRSWRVDVPGPLYPYGDDPDIISFADFVCYCFLVNLWSSIMRLFERNLTRIIAAVKYIQVACFEVASVTEFTERAGESSENNQVDYWHVTWYTICIQFMKNSWWKKKFFMRQNLLYHGIEQTKNIILNGPMLEMKTEPVLCGLQVLRKRARLRYMGTYNLVTTWVTWLRNVRKRVRWRPTQTVWERLFPQPKYYLNFLSDSSILLLINIKSTPCVWGALLDKMNFFSMPAFSKRWSQILY